MVDGTRKLRQWRLNLLASLVVSEEETCWEHAGGPTQLVHSANRSSAANIPSQHLVSLIFFETLLTSRRSTIRLLAQASSTSTEHDPRLTAERAALDWTTSLTTRVTSLDSSAQATHSSISFTTTNIGSTLSSFYHLFILVAPSCHEYGKPPKHAPRYERPN